MALLADAQGVLHGLDEMVVLHLVFTCSGSLKRRLLSLLQAKLQVLTWRFHVHAANS